MPLHPLQLLINLSDGYGLVDLKQQGQQQHCTASIAHFKQCVIHTVQLTTQTAAEPNKCVMQRCHALSSGLRQVNGRARGGGGRVSVFVAACVTSFFQQPASLCLLRPAIAAGQHCLDTSFQVGSTSLGSTWEGLDPD
jgi:hypothetical protein